MKRDNMDVNRLRHDIDMIDSGILWLIQERLERALLIGRLKSVVEDSKREHEVIKRLLSMKAGPIRTDFIYKLIRIIISESKKIQETGMPIVGFYGEHGAYSEIAIHKWRKDVMPVPSRSIKDLKEGLKSGIFDYCILPVKNSSSGSINETSELIMDNELQVQDEFQIPVHHCLLGLHDSKLTEIRRVISHPHALYQCQQFIKRKGFFTVRFWDTAGSARLLAERRMPHTAAIASILCSRFYGLKVLKESIEDCSDNATVFAVVSRSNR